MENLIQAFERFLDNDIETRLQAEWEKQIAAFQAEQPPEIPADAKPDMWDTKSKQAA